MKNEQIVDFNRRISQANRSQLVVIMYEIFFAYLADAKEAEGWNYEVYKTSIQGAEATVDRLMKTLDFSYEVSKELYALYQYVMRQLAKALYKNGMEEVEPAKAVMEKLYSAFVEVAKTDTSEVLMQNAQKVVAGMTYGKGSLVENYMDTSVGRGFLA